MPGKRIRDPVAGSTYGGFATPGVAHDEGDGDDAPGTRRARTYARSEMRRHATRRPWLPFALVATLVGVFAGGALIGVSLPHGHAPAVEPSAPQAPAPPPMVQPRAAVARLAPLAPQLAAPAAAGPRLELSPAPVRRPAEPVRPGARPPPRRKPPACAARSACGDPQIAALDRQVNEAFATAIRGGAAPGPLAETQENWIIRRDRAARQSPEIVADLDRARIAELQALSTPER